VRSLTVRQTQRSQPILTLERASDHWRIFHLQNGSESPAYRHYIPEQPGPHDEWVIRTIALSTRLAMERRLSEGQSEAAASVLLNLLWAKAPDPAWVGGVASTWFASSEMVVGQASRQQQLVIGCVFAALVPATLACMWLGAARLNRREQSWEWAVQREAPWRAPSRAAP
jgi:hypothetical protein